MMKKESTQKLEQLKQQALTLMADKGYPIKGELAIELDEKLPFMGYTTERDGKPVITVSGMALSGGALNLLIHEMSHIYRFQSGHPSHDYHLLTSMATFVLHGKAVEPYQEEIIHNALNNIQDLYADDISFKIFEEIAPDQRLNQFFLSWVKEPVQKGVPSEKAWRNADFLLSASFAQANLERHNVADTGGLMKNAITDFLSKVDKRLADKFPFFKEFMVNLPEKVSREEFEKLLIQYLSAFTKLTIHT